VGTGRRYSRPAAPMAFVAVPSIGISISIPGLSCPAPRRGPDG
jgi:hypothetical protein